MKKPKKTTTILIILVILLIAAVGYIAYDKYMDALNQRELQVYQIGQQSGYEQAVLQLMQQAATCQAVPLYAGNTTIEVVAVECLQQV